MNNFSAPAFEKLQQAQACPLRGLVLAKNPPDQIWAE
jgi:hypothetical protein